MTVSIGVTELHPYINVFFGRIITFPSQSPICLCQQGSNPVSSDGARTLIGILLEQISCDVQVILSSFSVFTSWFPNTRLCILLACQMFLTLFYCILVWLVFCTIRVNLLLRLWFLGLVAWIAIQILSLGLNTGRLVSTTLKGLLLIIITVRSRKWLLIVPDWVWAVSFVIIALTLNFWSVLLWPIV